MLFDSPDAPSVRIGWLEDLAAEGEKLEVRIMGGKSGNSDVCCKKKSLGIDDHLKLQLRYTYIELIVISHFVIFVEVRQYTQNKIKRIFLPLPYMYTYNIAAKI